MTLNDGKVALPSDIQTATGAKAFDFIRGDDNDPDVQYLKAYFGLGDSFPTD